MYKIAVCDDEVSTCSEIEHMILEYADINSMQIDVEVYYTGERLCTFLSNGSAFDLIFLDIELTQLNGIDAAGYIRNELNDERTLIIYISSKQNYAMSLFKTRPLDFLIKPITKIQIFEVLMEAFRLIDKVSGCFEYKFGQTYYKIPYKNIIYFQSEGKKIEAVLDNDRKVFYGKIKAVHEKLPNDFLWIHQSYIVNNKYVSKYTYELLEMVNGDVIAISKAKRKIIRQQIKHLRKEENS